VVISQLVLRERDPARSAVARSYLHTERPVGQRTNDEPVAGDQRERLRLVGRTRRAGEDLVGRRVRGGHAGSDDQRRADEPRQPVSGMPEDSFGHEHFSPVWL
jgi:hypothetical protein